MAVRPEDKKFSAGLKDPRKLGKDVPDLFLSEVLHDTKVVGTVERICFERKREDTRLLNSAGGGVVASVEAQRPLRDIDRRDAKISVKALIHLSTAASGMDQTCAVCKRLLRIATQITPEYSSIQ